MKARILMIAVLLAAPGAHAAFRCVDEKGITHIGDTPPAACAKVPLYEVSRTGAVLRKIDPTPTAEEVKARDEANARRREEVKAAAEQKRKDIALLSTYSTEKEFGIARDRNVEPLQGRINNLRERDGQVDKRIKAVEDELEFYQAGKSKSAKAKVVEPPAQLVADLERAKAEKGSIARNIAATEKEITGVQARFEADRARWKELKSNPGMRAGTTSTATAAPANWTRGSLRCGDKTVSCKRGESYLCLKSDGKWANVTCDPPTQ